MKSPYKKHHRRRTDRLKHCREKSKFNDDQIVREINKHLDRPIQVSTFLGWETRERELKDVNKLAILAEIYDVSLPWLAYRLGTEHHTYEQGKRERYLIDRYRKAPQHIQQMMYDFVMACEEEITL